MSYVPFPSDVITNSKCSTLDECETKYAHKYILKTMQDNDFIEPNYFGFGKAFHYVLEQTRHDGSNFKVDLLDEAINMEGLDHVYDKAKLLKCLQSYFVMHKKSGLKVLSVELTWMEESFGGIVDCIGIDQYDKWWIMDTKTAASLDPTKPSMVITDQQVNLYSHHHEAIREAIMTDFDIKLGEYAGFIYRETAKPTEKKKKVAEDFDTFYNRIKDVQSRETKVSKKLLTTDQVIDSMIRKSNRINELKELVASKGIKALSSNYRNCVIHNNPCKFFSACHGRQYSDIKKESEIDL